MSKLFPVEFEAKLMMTDGDRNAVVTIGLGHFKSPNEEEIQTAIQKAIASVQSKMPEMRPLTYPEVWDERIGDVTNSTMLFATPQMDKGDEWWREEDPKLVQEVKHARFSRHSEEEEEVEF